ncbi:MAG TPA: CocE/NonD family hydrolase, partial [Phenylobacterium sp.]|nr:CocE/NonD family hydrolase [Phenylobacterium sp.]
MTFLASLALATSATAAPRVVGDLPRKSPAFEEIAGVEAEYGVVRTQDGARLRSIVTRPAGATGRLPAIYYVQPLSCDTVEAVEAGGWSEMLKRLATESGRAFIRVEKSGVGDSQGPTCRALDYETELAHHGEAAEQLARHPWVDGGKVVLYGASMGARMAPALAAKRPYQGVVVWGGGGATWFQRQVEFQRRAHSAKGLSGLAQKSNQADAIYAAWLLEGRRPDPATDAWKALTGTHADGQFGRSFAWHEQAQKQ